MAEVGSAFVSILPSAKGFGRSLEGQVGGEVGGVGKSTGSKFGTAFKVGALAALGGAVLAGGFLKGAVSDASDLAENQSKVGVVFGKAAAQITAASKTSATSMGLTESAYLGATGSLGNLLVSLDLAPKKAANLSQEMVALAGDLASFNNVSPEEALAALQSGLTGETEPLKKFGVNMNDATLKAQAFKLGLIDTVDGALTPQSKALAAQALIMEQTSTAQGDFARTSGGLANQQRILGAQFGDLKATIGTALLPVMTQFVTFLNTSVIPGLTALGGYLATNLGPTFEIIKNAVAGVFSGGAGGGFMAVLIGIGAAIATNFLPVLQTMAATFTGSVLPAIQGFAAYAQANLLPVFLQVVGIIRDQVIPIVAAFAQFIYGTLYPAIIGIVTAVAGKLKPVFDQLVATFRAKVLPALQQLLAKFREYQPAIQQFIAVVVKIIGKLLEFAAAILGKVLPPLIRFAGFVLGTVVPAVIAYIDIVAQIIKKVIEFGTVVVNAVKSVAKFVSGLKEKFGEAIAFAKSVPGKILSALGDLGSDLYNYALAAAGRLVSGLVDGINAAVGKVKDAMSGLVGGIKGFLPGSPIKEGPLKSWNNGGAGKRLMDLLAKGIADGGPGVNEAMTKALEKLRDNLSTKQGEISSIIDTLRGNFDSLRDSIANTFSGNLFDVSAIAESLTETTYTAAQSVGQAFANGLSDKKAELTQLLGAFKTLKGFGLPSAFLSQLFASGNSALILEMASGSQSKALSSAGLFGDVTSLSDRLGGQVARNDPNYAELVKQTSELAEIKRQLRNLPKNIGREINGAATTAQRRAA